MVIILPTRVACLFLYMFRACEQHMRLVRGHRVMGCDLGRAWAVIRVP
jgi:hypothetical protein